AAALAKCGEKIANAVSFEQFREQCLVDSLQMDCYATDDVKSQEVQEAIDEMLGSGNWEQFKKVYLEFHGTDAITGDPVSGEVHLFSNGTSVFDVKVP